MNLTTLTLGMMILGLRPKLVETYDLSPTLRQAEESLDRMMESYSVSSSDMLRDMIQRHEDWMNSAMTSFLRGSNSLLNTMSSIATPDYEILNNPHKFQLRVELPGTKANDLQVQFNEQSRMLSISGQRESKGSGYRSSSSYSRSMTLDPYVEASQLTASMDDGVLVITAPKKEVPALVDKTSVRNIPVTSLREEDPVDQPLLGSEAVEEPTKTTMITSDPDPFHVRERIAKARFAAKEYDENAIPVNDPNKVLTDPDETGTYETSEFR